MRFFLGQRAWMLQRMTAVVLLVLVGLGAALVLVGPPLTFARWHALATSAHGAVLIVVFFVAVALHAWIGIRDVVLDYVHPPAVRSALRSGGTRTSSSVRVGLLQAYRFIADSRDRASAERLAFLDDVYRLYRCRTIMNCTEVCPKGLSRSHAIERIRLALVRESA